MIPSFFPSLGSVGARPSRWRRRARARAPATHVSETKAGGCAERFIRVLKENLLWVRPFDAIEELRLALQAFKDTCNRRWIIGRHGYRTPAQVRAEQNGSMPMAA